MKFYQEFREALGDECAAVRSPERRYDFIDSGLRSALCEFSNWMLPLTYVGCEILQDADADPYSAALDVDPALLRNRKQKLAVCFASNTQRPMVYKKYCNVMEALIGALCIRKAGLNPAERLRRSLLAYLVVVLVV